MTSEAGLRNNLPQIDVMNEVGADERKRRSSTRAWTASKRRSKILEDLEAVRLPVGTKDYVASSGQVRPLQDDHRASPIDAVVRENPAAG